MINKTALLTALRLLAVGAGTITLGRASAQGAGDASLNNKLNSPFAAFRLGVIVSPVASVDAGLDVTFPRLRVGRSWVPRLDIDLSARFDSPSFGSPRDAEIASTVCLVYAPGGVNRGRFFGGGGIGPTLGRRFGLGGKVFAGMNFSPVVSLEVEALFPADSGPRAMAMLRLSAL